MYNYTLISAEDVLIILSSGSKKASGNELSKGIKSSCSELIYTSGQDTKNIAIKQSSPCLARKLSLGFLRVPHKLGALKNSIKPK